MSGVYQIYNTVNGKRYIGSSIHIEQRFKEHLRNLRANKHVNAHLQSAWNKYGEHSFVFEAENLTVHLFRFLKKSMRRLWHEV